MHGQCAGKGRRPCAQILGDGQNFGAMPLKDAHIGRDSSNREAMPDDSAPFSHDPAEPQLARSPLVRVLLKVAGFFFVALGLIGAVLPILPTTIFMILAAGCFARSSPRFRAWLIGHRIFGPPVRAWGAEGAIPMPAKIIAVSAIFLSFGVTVTFAPLPFWADIALGAGLFVLSLYIITRPEPSGTV